jgi:predicted RNA polymerase sigma factor
LGTDTPAQAAAAQAAKHAAARAARDSYGRLLALLASRSGDLAGAQDALADAFHSALQTWPAQGVPTNPEAWLLTVARNRQRDVHGSAAHRTSVPLVEEEIDAMFLTAAEVDNDAIPDDRMKLLFVCAHPAIDSSLRAPLMLQTVLGLDAEVIARAFLVPASAMAQRLVRVKRKIKDARIPFELPSRSDLSERLEAVLEAIYGAFSIGWDIPATAPTTAPSPDPAQGAIATDLGANDLADEARYLADLLARLLPGNPEVLGLAAWVSLCNARRLARVSPAGHYVPLQEQDTALWCSTQIAWGELLLQRAHAAGAVGRFQLEAAIQSVHIDRARTGLTDWPALALLYEGLMRLAPAVGTAVARAVAVGEAQNPAAGLAALDLIEPSAREAFQPAWAARAHLLRLQGQWPLALAALDRALALAPNERVQQQLQRQRADVLQRCSGVAV